MSQNEWARVDEIEGPHAGQQILMAGPTPEKASGAVILLHGRGASAESILSLAGSLGRDDLLYLAPSAAANEWYPNRFIAPVESNEPHLTSALDLVDALFRRLENMGIGANRTIVGGFSQGACLSAEYLVRHPRRYGGALILSGGLIGPPGTTWDDSGDLEDTPIFLGCSDVDFHIPKERVEESARLFEKMNGAVKLRLYPGMGHTINDDELMIATEMVEELGQS